MDEQVLRSALKELVAGYEGEQAALNVLAVLDENSIPPSSLFEMEDRTSGSSRACRRRPAG